MKRISKVSYEKKKFVFESKKDYDSLSTKGFGYELNGQYYLSSYEAAYLLKKQKIVIVRKDIELSLNVVLSLKEIELDLFIVYQDLRSKGYYIGSGLKFGCDFRVYDKGHKKEEEHSRWLLRVTRDTKKLSFKDFSSSIRVSHSTHKKVLYAILDFEDSISYYETDWVNIS
jgi:tRNA-intron endonuclease